MSPARRPRQSPARRPQPRWKADCSRSMSVSVGSAGSRIRRVGCQHRRAPLCAAPRPPPRRDTIRRFCEQGVLRWPYRCAILDDYQNVALKLADWASSPDVEVKVFNEPFADQRRGAAAPKDFDDHRDDARAHPVPARGDRAAAEPEAADHHRHAQRLDRPEAAAERGIAVCGTGGSGNPTAGSPSA